MYSPFDITAAKWGEVSAVGQYDIALLPWGSTEPHNRHLPYCTDMLASQAIAFEAAERAHEKGVEVMVLPGIPLGSQNPGQTHLPFCLHATQETQKAVLGDIVDSLQRAGIRRLLIINGHGGNSFKGMIRDFALTKPGFLIVSSEWYNFIPRKDYFEADVDDHAGEQETSVMLHYYPELVRMDLAGDGDSRAFAIQGLRNKVGGIPRDWSAVTSDTGIGNPKASSAEKGKRYAEVVVGCYADLISDLCTRPIYG